MKKITTILFAFIIVLASCGKPDIVDDSNNGGDSTGSETVVNYNYKISGHDRSLTNLVLDNNNNAYIYVKAGSDYKLISIDTDGKLRWSKTFANAQHSMLGNGIMIVNDKILLSYSYDKLGCYTTTDGSEIWDVQLNKTFSELAYNNNVVYVAQSAAYVGAELTAYDISTGFKNWTEEMNFHNLSRISIDGDYICISSRDENNHPYKSGITMFKENGNGVSELWSFYEVDDNHLTKKFRRKAIFDGKGNVFYESGASDSCYVFSFKKNSGNLNWKSLISSAYPQKTTLLYGNGKIICSYKHDKWSDESVAIIDATSGTIEKEIISVIESINNGLQMLLTGNFETLVFNNINNQKASIQLYNINGTLSKTIVADFYDSGNMTFDLEDAKIDTHGNLVLSLDGIIMSAKLGLATIGTNSWNYPRGTNGDANSLNK